jgi:hypothetical protein
MNLDKVAMPLDKCERARHHSFTANVAPNLGLGVSDEMSKDIPVQAGPLHVSSSFAAGARIQSPRLTNYLSCRQVPNGQAQSAHVQF